MKEIHVRLEREGTRLAAVERVMDEALREISRWSLLLTDATALRERLLAGEQPAPGEVPADVMAELASPWASEAAAARVRRLSGPGPY